NQLINAYNPFTVHFNNPTRDILKILFPENKLPPSLNNIKGIIDFAIMALHGILPRLNNNKWIIDSGFIQTLRVPHVRYEYYQYLTNYYLNLNNMASARKLEIHETFTATELYLTKNGTSI